MEPATYDHVGPPSTPELGGRLGLTPCRPLPPTVQGIQVASPACLSRSLPHSCSWDGLGKGHRDTWVPLVTAQHFSLVKWPQVPMGMGGGVGWSWVEVGYVSFYGNLQL